MSKAFKIAAIIAALLVVVGGILFVAVMAANDWNFRILSTARYETNTYEITEDFADLSICTDTADVVLLPTTDGTCKVVCHEQENVKHSVAVSNGTLVVQASDMRKWYDHIGIFSFGSPKLTVYLPEAQYSTLAIETDTGDMEIPKSFQFSSINISASTGDVTVRASALEHIKIATSTGKICVDGVSANALELSTSTGDVAVTAVVCEGEIRIGVSTGETRLSDVSCKNLTTSGSTGEVFLKNVTALETLSVERSTGDVKLERCDATEIFIKTDTGDVEGSLLSEKIFFTQTDTGDVEVPRTSSGGRCEITTDTGDIAIEICH